MDGGWWEANKQMPGWERAAVQEQALRAAQIRRNPQLFLKEAEDRAQKSEDLRKQFEDQAKKAEAAQEGAVFKAKKAEAAQEEAEQREKTALHAARRSEASQKEAEDRAKKSEDLRKQFEDRAKRAEAAQEGAVFKAEKAEAAQEGAEQREKTALHAARRSEASQKEAEDSAKKSADLRKQFEDRAKKAEAAQEVAEKQAQTLEDEKRRLLEKACTQDLQLQRMNELLQPQEAAAIDRFAFRSSRATQIQKKWRNVASHARAQRQQDEIARQVKQANALSALVSLQKLWRTRQQKLRQRRERCEAQRMARPTTKYDAILEFHSLDQFISQRKIQLLRAVESHFDIAKESSYRIIAIVGLFDKGKTYLINKLFGVNLPSGKLFTTKGLSFLWIEHRRMLVLDSAGVQNTVSYRAQAVQPILDAQTTESLVFEMVSRIAHHLIFVVSDLTWFEQKYVAMLHQKYVKACQSKELIVVHNLRATGIVEEAQKLFKRQVLQCYDGEKSHLGDLLFIADHGHGVPPVHHIGICNEASSAGLRFNGKNFELLLQQLEHRSALGTKLVLSHVLQHQYEDLLPKFVNVETDRAVTLERGPVEEQLSVQYVPTSQAQDTRDGYVQAGTLEIATSGHRVAMKTRGVITSLGEIIAHDVSFEPVVNVYDKRCETEIARFIQVECPGITEDDIEWEELPNGIKITITKRKAIDEVAVQPVNPIRQHHGTWEKEFVFDASEGHFEVRSQEEFDLSHGVLTVVLHRRPLPRRGRLGNRSSATPNAANVAFTPLARATHGPPPPSSMTSDEAVSQAARNAGPHSPHSATVTNQNAPASEHIASDLGFVRVDCAEQMSAASVPASTSL